MLLRIVLGSIVAGFPLVCVEIASRRVQIKPEFSRKSTHVLSALSVVCIAAFCSLKEIAIIAALFTILLTTTRATKLWHSLYRISRASWGEVLFPLGVCAAALISPSTRAFICAIVILGTADTAANLAGQKFGVRKLPALGPKTYVGTATFFAASIVWLVLFVPHAGALSILILAVLASIAEATAGNGFDNLAIPVVVTTAMRLMEITK